MISIHRQHGLSLLLSSALLLTLAACKTSPKPPPDANAKPEVRIAQGEVRMPSNADRTQSKLVEQGRKAKIYTRVRGMGDPSNEKLLFPAQVAAAIGVTPVQVQRRFLDTISKTRRYEVYDNTTSVTAEQSDFVVDAIFTGTTQELRRIEGGVRVAVTRVRLSARLESLYDQDRNKIESGVLFETEVVGETGNTTGDRVVLAASDNENSPEVQRRLGLDYERAMQRAFELVTRRLEQQLRPQGRVLSVDGTSIGLAGGARNGLQGGDELVLFRATVAKLGSREEFSSVRPLAAVRCDGVGTATSQCEVIRRDPRYTPQVGDFAILTDRAASATRVEL